MAPEKHDPRRDRAKDGWPTSSYIESQGPQRPEDGTALEGLGKQNEQGELSMDKDYKAHDIHATASYVPEGWKPHLYVVYSEGGRNIIKNFTIDQTFSTREEAEQAGLSFAQKWIDDGKPDLTP
jgi:hypothetical protein